MAKAKKKKVCPYQKVTDLTIDLIESKNLAPWIKTWENVGGINEPTSMSSGKPYNGMNVLWLSMARMMHGYTSNIWGTWKAIKANDGVYEKGYHDFLDNAETVTFWSKFPSKEIDKRTGKPKEIWFQRTSPVVNMDLVTFPKGVPKKWVVTDEPDENLTPPLEIAQEVMDNYFNGKGTPTLRHGGDKAYYMPAKDLVVLPERKNFKGNNEYYSVAFHEMGHSTGHESRLSREGITAWNGFGSHKYSKEELVAEFTACFLCHHVGITDTRENSASYLKGWVAQLKEQPKMLLQASTKAKKATEFILNPTGMRERGYLKKQDGKITKLNGEAL